MFCCFWQQGIHISFGNEILYWLHLLRNIDKIKDGIGDKVGMIVRGITMYVTCLVVGFIYEWRITLVMLGTGPVSAALLSFMAQVKAKNFYKDRYVTYLTIAGE